MSDFSTIFGPQNMLTDDEFREQIIPVVQNILRKEFPNNSRRQSIKKFKDRLNFACPICGDSAHDDSKKRGNIILEGPFKNMYKCHNCGVSMSLRKFFDSFGHTGTISGDASLYLLNTKRTNNFYNSSVDRNSDLLTEIKEIEELSVKRDVLKTKMGLIETNVPSKGKTYLVNRHQFDFKRFLYSPYNDELYVLNLTPDGNIFSFQVRSLRQNYKGPKYRTFCLSNIYGTFFNMSDEELEKYKVYDSLSMLFNVLTVDYSRDVFVTEGPMDAFLIRNCIAACGGSKKIPLDVDLFYIYDYDEAGKKYAIEAINEGRRVFLWTKFANVMGLPPRSKWDWNDLVIYCSQNNIQIPNHTEFFSNDPLDIMFI